MILPSPAALETPSPVILLEERFAVQRASRVSGKTGSGIVLLLFVAVEILCQLALLVPSLSHFRVVFRMAPFLMSIGLLFLLPTRRKSHPAGRAGLYIVGIVGLALLNPGTNNFLSGMAQIGMYLAILGPVFWVPRLDIDHRQLYRFILVMWLFASTSSALGILQVYRPDIFPETLSTVIQAQSKGYRNMLMFRNASGSLVFRPSGLTDVPGGASMSGMYACLFATALLLTTGSSALIAASGSTMVLGLTVIYLSQVRSIFLFLAIGVVVLIVLLLRRAATPGMMSRAERKMFRTRVTTLIAALALTAATSLSLAVAVGGESVLERFETLTADSPTEVYKMNRGIFLAYTFYDVLPEYPLGAGLGRWGMMRYYFGDNHNPLSWPIWSEIQWTGWAVDGGYPLVLTYLWALYLALAFAYQSAVSLRDPQIAVWGAMVVAFSIGAIADTFAGNFFMSQGGLDYWMLNGALYAGVISLKSRPATPPLARDFRPLPISASPSY